MNPNSSHPARRSVLVRRKRAPSSGIKLTNRDATQILGMWARGDRMHDIAAWFAQDSGRIAEIVSGKKFAHGEQAPDADLPPPGPYRCVPLTH